MELSAREPNNAVMMIRTFGVAIPEAAEPARQVARGPLEAALLVYLVYKGQVDREAVLDRFWPPKELTGADDAVGKLRDHREAARRNLNQALLKLRQEDRLDDENFARAGMHRPLIIPRDTYRLDAVEFEAAIESGAYDAAVELYRGAFLMGLKGLEKRPEVDEWVHGRRRQLANKYGDAVKRLCGDELAKDESAEAVRLARRWVDLAWDGDKERAYSNLIDVLDRSGEPEQAVRAYEDLEQELALLGGPDPDLKALVGRIREDLAGGPKRTPRPTGGSLAPDTDKAGSRRPLGPRLVRTVVEEENVKEVFMLDGDGTTIIGRRQGNLTFPDDNLLSARHAQIQPRQIGGRTHFFLSDLGSSNGVFVDMSKEGKRTLQNGDSFVLGRHTFRFIRR